MCFTQQFYYIIATTNVKGFIKIKGGFIRIRDIIKTGDKDENNENNGQ